MADLTNYNFDVARPQRGAVEAQNSETVFGGVLKGFDTALSALDSKKYNDRLDAEEENTAGVNAIAARTFQTDVEANTNIPDSARTAVAGLDNTKAAVEQGRLPQTAYGVQLQKNVSQVLQMHPDSAAKVIEYMRQSGHDHPMFQALQDQQKSQDTLNDSLYQARDTAIKYAYANGVSLDTPPDQAAIVGNQLMAAHALQVQAAAAAQAAKEGASADIEGYKNTKAIADAQGLQGVQQEISARLTPIWQTMTQQVTAAIMDPARSQQMQTTVLPLVDNMAGAAKSSAYNQLIHMGIATPDNIKVINEQIDQMAGGMKAVFTDQSGGLQRTVQNLRDTYNLQVAQIAPVIYKLGSMIGNSNVVGLLDSTSTMDPEMKKTLAKEWAGVSSGADGQIHLNNIVSILKGNTNLQDYSPADAAKYIGAVASGQKSSEQAILMSGGQNVDHQVYLNTTSNLINAAHALTPASDTKDLVTASQLIATPATRQALDKLATNPETREQAEAVGMASHAASIKLLQDFSTQAPRTNKFQSIVFDPNKGAYIVKFDQDAFNKDKGANGGGSPSERAFRLRAYSTIDKTTQGRADAMNSLLDHAIKTSKYDTDIPKTATPLQLRRAYATNTPVPSRTAQSADANDLWTKAENRLEETLRAAPTAFMQQDDARSKEKPADKPLDTATASGMPQDIADAQIAQESGGKSGIVSKQGAVGIAQIRPDDYPQYDAKRLKDDPQYALAARDEIMKQLIKKHQGNVFMALAEYHGGPDQRQWGPKTFGYVNAIMNKGGK